MKTIKIDGKEFRLEQRTCSLPRCHRVFEVYIKSKQHVCSIDCWEVTHGKPYSRASFVAPLMKTNKSDQKKHIEDAKKRKKSYNKTA